LRFFGDLPQDQVEQIKGYLQTMKSISAFDVEAQGLSHFETKRQIILHAPVISTRKITALAQAVTDCAGLVGLTYEPRPFVPHITIGRLRGKNNLDEYCQVYGHQIKARWRVGEFHLLESGARDQGKPRYKILQTYPLSHY
jgi:RNA 2',3'-cyclic 3'-phosphodiesterase